MAGAATAPPEPADWYRRVEPLCLARLAEAHDPASGLFARQLRDGRPAPTLGTEALTGTAICLIGLARAGLLRSVPGLDPARSLAAVAAEMRRTRYAGALGLALWADAALDGTGAAGLLHDCGLDAGRLAELAPRLTAMELAWLVSGVLHEAERQAVPPSSAAGLVRALRGRQCGSGLFVHAGKGVAGPARLRRFVANFADQIYAVQALAFAALAGVDGDALATADRCAAALCVLAGPEGEWWWHYEPRSGAVLRRWPVYSVHQYGMAPMALMALAAAGGADHRDAAWRGLGWLDADGQPLREAAAGTVWRDLRPRQGRLARLFADLRTLAGVADSRDPGPLRVNRETRPYEWGWCLMAGAQLAGPPPRPHLA